MLKTMMTIAAITFFAACAYSADLSNSALVARIQNSGQRITDIISTIENEFSARQAVAQLEKLAPEFNRLRTEFANRQKADPMSLIRFSTDIVKTISSLKTAMTKFNANDNVPFELRQQIEKMIGKL